jgi:hypothetical protein
MVREEHKQMKNFNLQSSVIFLLPPGLMNTITQDGTCQCSSISTLDILTGLTFIHRCGERGTVELIKYYGEPQK